MLATQTCILLCGAIIAGAMWLYHRALSRTVVHCYKGGIVSAIIARCPSLQHPWRAVPWLQNGHAQTLAVAKLRRRPQMTFARELFALSDGGQVGLDFAPVNPAHDTPDAPVLVVLHGLNGGSMENYVRHLVVRATTLGFRCVVMVARGLGGVALKSWRPYNAGWTADIRETVAELHKRYPNAKIVAAGYSLGANVLTRFVGEEGDHCLLTAAAAVSNPYDLGCSQNHLETTGRMGRLYSENMARGLQRFTKKNADMLSQAPTKPDIEGALRARSCREYDACATSKIFGFATADEYYAHFSSLPLIAAARTPLLLVSANDDPMTGPVLVERAATEALRTQHVAVAASPRGGHVAFLEAVPTKSLANWWHAEDSWADSVVCEFLSAALQN